MYVWQHILISQYKPFTHIYTYLESHMHAYTYIDFLEFDTTIIVIAILVDGYCYCITGTVEDSNHIGNVNFQVNIISISST